MVERFIGNLKSECMDLILVPFREWKFRRELAVYADWYNQHLLHSVLGGWTPAEAYDGVTPASQVSRLELRAKWPAAAPCASPQAPVAGGLGAVARLRVRYHTGKKHLPIVALKCAA